MMTEENNLQSFDLECLDLNNTKRKATINIWMRKEACPTVYDFPTNKAYTYTGIVEMYFLEYKDDAGKIVETKSDKISNAFYNLCSEIEENNIRMLIKGCSFGYYMIPRLHHSIYATPLSLGKRIDKNFEKTNIFLPESSVDKITPARLLNKYYNEWLDSIKGIPY